MEKYSIRNVPRYYEPHVNDCYQTAISSCILYKGINLNLALADYVSFMFEEETGYIGINYLHKYNTSVIFTEEQLNTSLKFFRYMPGTEYYPGNKTESMANDKINVLMYYTDDNGIAYSRLKELLKKDTPTVIAVDLYYMKYHRAFNKEHGLHNVVVVGFDEEEGVFELFDKYKLSSSDFDGQIPIMDVNKGRCSENPLYNSVVGSYCRPIRNLWTEIIIGENFKIKNDDLLFIIHESCMRMSGERIILGRKCGLGEMELFGKSLKERLKSGLDEDVLNLYKIYYCDAMKVMSRNRKRFGVFLSEVNKLIPHLSLDEARSCLEQSVKNWEISSMLCYKMGLSKNLSICDALDEHIKKVYEFESKAMDLLYDQVKGIF